MWASGDFHAVATLIQPVADALCDAADLQAGWRVLDVACGSGNAAHRRRPLRRRRRRHRLRPGSARARPASCRGGRARGRPARRRRGVDSVPGRELRRRCCRSSARCSRRTTGGRRRSWRASAAPAARSASSPGRPTGSSARCSRSLPGTCRRRQASPRPALGNRVAPARALRRHDRQPRVHGADVHVALPLGRGVRRLLPHLLRPDVQGVRSRRARLEQTRSTPTWSIWSAGTPARTPARSRSPRRGWRRSRCRG